MAQLAFWSDQLSHGGATREGVSKAALVEARQVPPRARSTRRSTASGCC
jgi:hypothetical protein